MTKALTNDKRDYITALNEYSEEMFTNDGVTLEVFITERLSAGETLLQIAKKLDFPAVHMTTWLTKEHPELINAANRIYSNKESARIMHETWVYDEDNYKSESAKHAIQLRILEKQNDDIGKSQEDMEGGMSFNINVVMPDYVTGAPKVVNEGDERSIIEIGKND